MTEAEPADPGDRTMAMWHLICWFLSCTTKQSRSGLWPFHATTTTSEAGGWWAQLGRPVFDTDSSAPAYASTCRISIVSETGNSPPMCTQNTHLTGRLQDSQNTVGRTVLQCTALN